jgi:hypothetical protein
MNVDVAAREDHELIGLGVGGEPEFVADLFAVRHERPRVIRSSNKPCGGNHVSRVVSVVWVLLVLLEMGICLDMVGNQGSDSARKMDGETCRELQFRRLNSRVGLDLRAATIRFFFGLGLAIRYLVGAARWDLPGGGTGGT